MGRSDANAALVRRFIDEIFVATNSGAVEELVAPDFVSHTWGFTEDGRERLRATTERMATTLRDIRFDLEDVVTDGDRVVVRLTSSATPTGDFMGVPAAGRPYRIGEIHWFRVADGRIAEHWHQHDALGLLRQLGGLPGAGSG